MLKEKENEILEVKKLQKEKEDEIVECDKKIRAL
jgi:hypothetical protein